MKKVFVNGCFDVLHRGHIELLQFARSQGNYLVVGIDADSRVQELKGPGRPINNQWDRRHVLEALMCVNRVEIFFSTTTLESLVAYEQPDIMVVGSDYRDKRVIGSEFAKELVFFERIPGYSTTAILQSNDQREGLATEADLRNPQDE